MVKTSQVGLWDKETGCFLRKPFGPRKLVQHLTCSSRKCLASYIAFAKPLDIDAIRSLESNDRVTDKGKNRFAELSSVRVDGPLLPAPDNESLTTALTDGVAPLLFSCGGRAFVTPWNIPVAPCYAPVNFRLTVQ